MNTVFIHVSDIHKIQELFQYKTPKGQQTLEQQRIKWRILQTETLAVNTCISVNIMFFLCAADRKNTMKTFQQTKVTLNLYSNDCIRYSVYVQNAYKFT